MKHAPLVLLLAGVVLLVAGCDGGPAPSATAAVPAGERVPGVAYDEQGHPAGLHRHIRWSEGVGQGAQPEGEEAFANLARLGYRTILSVDGSAPEVEAAEAHGLRYVHVPIGYDGIPAEAVVKLVKTCEVSEGPVYVHCHHGKHRGPAAAALLRMTRDGITNEEAVQGLETSETSPKYKGLFRDVRAFRAPSAESLAQVGALPSRVMPAGLRAVMVDVSQRFEALKLSRAADWKKPADHPDVDPPHEARMLWELYRELSRTDTAAREKGDAFLATLKTSEEAAIALEEALRAGDAKAAGVHFLEVQNLCSRCHETHRD